MAPVTGGKLLKFPERETHVYRDCACCGRTMPIPTDLEAKWGNDEFLCFVCFLWLKSHEEPDLYKKITGDNT